MDFAVLVHLIQDLKKNLSEIWADYLKRKIWGTEFSGLNHEDNEKIKDLLKEMLKPLPMENDFVKALIEWRTMINKATRIYQLPQNYHTELQQLLV